MDPMTAFTALQVVVGGASAMAAHAEAMDQSARQESEARLADTQALQRDTIARDELTRFLSSVRSARAANGLSADTPNAFILEKTAIKESDSNRLLERADDQQRAANYRAAAKSSRKSALYSLVTGAAKAAIPLAEYKAYKG